MTYVAICVPRFDTDDCRVSVENLIAEFKRRDIRGELVECDARPLEMARTHLLWRARKTPFTHQFCLDGDVAFAPQAFFELFDAKAPLVCGAYRSRNPDDRRFIVAPKREPIEKSIIRQNVFKNGPRLIEIEWGNLGFALVMREALDDMIKQTKELEFEAQDGTVLHALYQTYTRNRRYHSEDVSFYRCAKMCGIEALCAIDCELWHAGVHGRLGELFP